MRPRPSVYRLLFACVVVGCVSLPFTRLEWNCVESPALVEQSKTSCVGEEMWLSRLCWRGDELEVTWEHEIPEGANPLHFILRMWIDLECQYYDAEGVPLVQTSPHLGKYSADFLAGRSRREKLDFSVRPPREAVFVSVSYDGPNFATRPVRLPWRPLSHHFY